MQSMAQPASVSCLWQSHKVPLRSAAGRCSWLDGPAAQHTLLGVEFLIMQ